MNKEQLIAFLKQARETATDQTALQGKELYSVWKSGEEVKAGERRQYNDKLWKCRQAHTTQEGWEPGTETAAMWEVIDETHAGTIDDPIPAAKNMEYIKDLYYIEEGTIYLCTQGTGQAVAYLPSELVGINFEEVEA